MSTFRCQPLLLLFLPVVSCLVSKFHGQVHPRRTGSFPARRSKSLSVGVLGSGRTRSRRTALNLGVDPVDAAHHAASAATAAGSLLSYSHAGADTTSALDILSADLLSTMFSAKATSIAVVPNQSLIPLPETVKSTADAIIPDLQTMPGGAPRHASPFLSESFRSLFNAPRATSGQTNWSAQSGPVEVSAREWDLAGRYADLLNRIPTAAVVYAFVDFFLINAEEDVHIGELIDDDDAKEILGVESSAVMTRIVGLFLMVLATVAVSSLTYHPVPFRELL